MSSSWGGGISRLVLSLSSLPYLQWDATFCVLTTAPAIFVPYILSTTSVFDIFTTKWEQQCLTMCTPHELEKAPAINLGGSRKAYASV